MDCIGVLSRAHTVRLRGLLACCVVLCHLLDSPWAYRMIPSSIVGALGYFSVACFFFLSGYGLTFQYRRKGAQYLASFPRSRILPFWLLSCIFAVVYTVLTLITNNESVTCSLLLQTLTFGPDTIISKGWYLQVALVCYIAFYLVFRYVPGGWGKFAVGCGLLVLYTAVCAACGFSVSYYQTVPNFLLGCVWHRLAAEKPRLPLAAALIVLWSVIWVASIYAPAGSIAGTFHTTVCRSGGRTSGKAATDENSFFGCIGQDFL